MRVKLLDVMVVLDAREILTHRLHYVRDVYASSVYMVNARFQRRERMDKCQCCGEEGQDRRTLFMECFYAMEELGIPFNRLILQDREGNERTFYTLKVCKECRANWMNAIKQWFNNVQKQGSCGSGIFVRRNGATVEIPREEWDKQNPGREPVVFKGEQ